MSAPLQNMNKRKVEILWKYYVVFIIVVFTFMAVVGKIVYIQFWEGNYWISLSQKQQIKQHEIETPRGTIYSNTGDILSISLPRFDVYMDLGVKPLHTQIIHPRNKEKKIEMFYLYVDSLAIVLAQTNPMYSASFYKQKLLSAYGRKVRYMMLLDNIDYNQYLRLNQSSFVKMGQNKSGIIFEEKNVRKYPYEELAMRTVGLFRPNSSSSVGLERMCDTILKGRPGKQLVKKIAPNVYIPISGTNIEPERGKDIYTTLDMNMQNIVQTALKKRLQKNNAEWGTVILMEVQTGKIKAICNLQKGGDEDYHEIYNHAIEYHEPGSTFKLLSMMALLDEYNIDIHKMVNVNYGKWGISKKDTIYDSEVHPNQSLSVEDVFCLSSNVGTARLITDYFGKHPKQYINCITQLRINEPIGLLPGERISFIKNPNTKLWTPTTLAWMSFGYELMISPLQLLSVYNGIANNGVMMQPYLIESIGKDGTLIKTFSPSIRVSKMANQTTIQTMQQLLENVVKKGTAKGIYTTQYGIAGKTGTAKVAEGASGYSQRVYQTSFAGYFPTQNPMYSCIVVIQNKKGVVAYGSSVAAPVFKEIADNIMNRYVFVTINYQNTTPTNMMPLSTKYVQGLMPNLQGWSLQDALAILENEGVQVSIQGKGKIIAQSLPEGALLQKNMRIVLTLGT